MRNSMLAGLALIVSSFLVGCATGPAVRTDYDRSVDFSSFQTFGFASELGTDRGGYASLLTEHFKSAVRNEMETRGFRHVDVDPDLTLNFFAHVTERSELIERPTLGSGAGYYDYRDGLYTAWPTRYEQEVIRYQVGTATVDVVDARRSQLIWESTAEGRLAPKALDNPKTAVKNTVRELFAPFPASARPGAG